MRKGNTFTRSDATKETSKLQAKMDCDPEMVAALTGEDGIFKSGLLPHVSAATSSASKQILDLAGQAASRCQVGAAGIRE